MAVSSSPVRPATKDTPRRWDASGFLPFRLEVLTPVFVGSGEDLSPLDYVIRQEGGDDVLHLVDGESWLQASYNDSAVRAALNNGDLLLLRRLMAEQLDAAQYSRARIPVTLPEVARGLRQRIADPESNSKAEIMPFVRNDVTGCAFLPGSSLKGALSTPIIDERDGLLRQKGCPDLRTAYKDTLKQMFGEIREHAMQALKVADITLPPQATRLVAAREASLKADKKGTPKTPCEALTPSAAGGLPLYGSLHLDSRSGQPAVELPDGSLLSRQRLGELCNAFYKRRFLDEWQKFYALPHLAGVRQALQPVRERLERLDPAWEWLVRVGRYSHLECVTVSRNAPGHQKGFGKTRTLADGLLPFGWVILHFCSPEDYTAGTQAVDTAIATALQQREAAHAAREAALREALQQQRQRQETAARQREAAEAEQRRKEEEAARREEQMAGLSPQERAIAALDFADADKETALALFRLLDDMDGALQQRAAVALKAFWEKIGEWQVKKISKKQKEKVTRVKAILGE